MFGAGALAPPANTWATSTYNSVPYLSVLRCGSRSQSSFQKRERQRFGVLRLVAVFEHHMLGATTLKQDVWIVGAVTGRYPIVDAGSVTDVHSFNVPSSHISLSFNFHGRSLLEQ
jgi:hypothetical protein